MKTIIRSSMKKMLYVIFFCMLVLFSVVEAGAVRVKGTGMDKESAMRDAMRVAVERVIGTYIDSKTLMEQMMVVEDRVLAKAQGFVTDVQVISEGEKQGSYWVDAKVEVNENPNSELRNQLQMVMMLGNPRIGVIMFKQNKSQYGSNGGMEYDNMVELGINEKLRSLGFNHVVDANIVAKLRNSSLLTGILNNSSDGGYVGENMGGIDGVGMDILIIGSSSVDSAPIKLMNIQNTEGREGSFDSGEDTPLIKGSSVVTGKIVVLSTGEIKQSFKSIGVGVDTVNDTAQMKASDKAAQLVAVEVEKALRNKAAQLVQGKQIIAVVSEEAVLKKLLKQLKNMKGMDDVKVRTFNAGKAIIDLDTSLSLMNIFRNLRDGSGLIVRNEGLEGDVINLFVEQE